MLNCAARSTRRCWVRRLSPACSRRIPSACALKKRKGKSGSGWRRNAPLANRRSLTCVRRRIRTAPPRSGCRRIWRRICASTAATRWCAISCCASATTTGTGISAITTCWWMASVSRQLPDRSPPFTAPGSVEKPPRNRLSPPLPKWWTSTSATPAARPGSGIKPSGRPSARRYRLPPRSLPLRWAGAPPGAISGG